MAARIPFAGVSRLDGAGEDGIHLVWGLPERAGWSVDGFDIQRRKSQGHEPKDTCFELSPALLAALHTDRHVEVPPAHIYVRDTTCPVGAPATPNDPAADDDDTRICIDFAAYDQMPDEIDADGFRISRDQDTGGSFEIVQQDGRRGILFEEAIEVQITEPACIVDLSAWLASDNVVAQVLSAEGDILSEDSLGAVFEATRDIVFADAQIDRIRLVAQGGKGILLNVCRRNPAQLCWTFDRPPGTRLDNPFTERGAAITVLDEMGALEPQVEFHRFDSHTGLSIPFSVRLDMASDVCGATLTLVHFSSPPTIRGYDAAGALLFERKTNLPHRTPTDVSVAAPRLRTVEVIAPQAETLLLKACFYGARDADDVPVTRQDCLVYDIQFKDIHPFASLTLGVSAAYVIGMSEGEAVAAYDLSGAGLVEARFDVGARGIDRILAYTRSAARKMRICTEPFADPKLEDAEWASAGYIVKNHQMPFREVDPGLGSADDEWAKAQSHLLPGETVPRGHFDEIAGFAATVTSAGLPHRATLMTARNRPGPGDPPIDVAAWPFMLSLTTDATWRRIVALGFLDDQGLSAGDSYDYRITGRFRRMDVAERVYGFHTIPVGSALPGRVYLDGLGLHMPGRGKIEFIPTGGGGTMEAGRRALAVEKYLHFAVPALNIELPEPTDHVVLEIEGGDSYEATSEANLLGGGPGSFHGAFVGAGREVLTFPDPVETIRIQGDARLFAVRIPDYSPGLDPMEVIQHSSVIYNVVHDATPAPPAPSALGTINLQTAPPPPDKMPGQRKAPDNLGFRLYWPPAAPTGSYTGIWPEDLDAAPPSEALYYHIDRRDVTDGGPWEPLSDDTGPSRFFASRGAEDAPTAIAYGADLMAHFPERYAPKAPVSTLASAEDAVTIPQRGGPKPGTNFQYRIRSVDIIGRESADQTGGIVRLEKLRPPPGPSGPLDPDNPAAIGEPQGVRARVLIAGAPGLSAQDQTDLAGAANAIVVEWGWHDNQRSEDPWATEFRVYLQDPPFDAVTGTVTGPHSMTGPNIAVPVTFDRAMPADRVKGLVLYSGGYPFRILAQTAGTSGTLTLKPLQNHPSARPVPGAFTMHPPLDGSELNGAAWSERAAVVPITGESAYRFVFRNRLTLSPAQPRHRVWVGVSAADDQSYRPDSRTSGPFAGRPGNESTVSAIDVIGRYRGRPAFSAPPLLEDVPEVILPEPTLGGVAFLLDLASDLPSGLVTAGAPVVVEYLNLSSISSRIETTSSGVRFAAPDASTVDYAPAAPADRDALIASVRAGQPGAIAGKFLRAILAAAGTKTDELWEPAVTGTVPFGPVMVTVPGDAARYVYRVRLADAGGRRSEEGAVTEHIYRVPDLAPPRAPEIVRGATTGPDVAVDVRVSARFDVTHAALFVLSAPAGTDFSALTGAPPDVLRVPNLHGQYPDDGIRLRLSDGQILAPTVLNLASATAAPPDLVATTSVTVGLGQQAALWAIAINRDGAPSRATGPVLVGGAPVQPVAPVLTVTRTSGVDTLSWPAAAPDVEIAVERSVDAGTTWERVSGWLRPAARTVTYTATGGAQTRYRLSLRTSAAMAEGPTVQPS